MFCFFITPKRLNTPKERIPQYILALKRQTINNNDTTDYYRHQLVTLSAQPDTTKPKQVKPFGIVKITKIKLNSNKKSNKKILRGESEVEVTTIIMLRETICETQIRIYANTNKQCVLHIFALSFPTGTWMEGERRES